MSASRSGLAPSHAWPGIICGALLLCWPAAFNGYPLVFADTGNYLGQALQHFVGWNAPPFYSFFLLATDLRLSLWLPVLAQALIMAHLLSVVLRQFGWRGPWPVAVACLALALATSLPWVVCLLTTDVFTGVVILTAWLLAFGSLGRWERLYVTALAAGAVAVHLSHVPLAIGLLVVGGLLAAGTGGARRGIAACLRMAVPPAIAAALLVAVNLVAHGIPALAPYGIVVTAARFIGDGTAQDYLRAACPTHPYRICGSLDQLDAGGGDFLFHRPALEARLGGFKAWAPEARAVVMGTIAYEPLAVARASLSNTVRQFGHLWLGDPLVPWRGSPGPEPLIARYFPHDLPAFQGSRQYAGKLRAEAGMLAPLQLACAWGGLAALLALLLCNRRDHRSLTFCAMVLAAVLGNALITASLSGVEDRYESRITWLMAFAPALVLATLYWQRRTRAAAASRA